MILMILLQHLLGFLVFGMSSIVLHLQDTSFTLTGVKLWAAFAKCIVSIYVFRMYNLQWIYISVDQALVACRIWFVWVELTSVV